jgi:hypothetical protein
MEESGLSPAEGAGANSGAFAGAGSDAVDAEDTSVEVTLELEGTTSSLLPSSEAGAVGIGITPTPASLRISTGATGGVRLGTIPPCVIRPVCLLRLIVRAE